MREMRRILAAGASVNKVGRINNSLNLSRSIGDLAFKHRDDLSLDHQAITSFPDIK